MKFDPCEGTAIAQAGIHKGAFLMMHEVRPV